MHVFVGGLDMKRRFCHNAENIMDRVVKMLEKLRVDIEAKMTFHWSKYKKFLPFQIGKLLLP